jgi:asparagine synthase (glutamine-hydrolysing)
MCGIAGSVSFGEGEPEQEAVRAMCETMRHRGPNARGIRTEPGVALGMQRLSIIDVAGGDQPIANEDDTVLVVMNGEIYNFPELRERLVARGHMFSSHSDTEVLVHLYEERGPAMVSELRGMFAFAIWDRPRRRLMLARDRVGKKPLFYTRAGGHFVFASEMRALLAHPAIERRANLAAINAFLALQYVPDPMSAVEGVRKLPPASTLLITTDGERLERYWQLDYRAGAARLSDAEAEERLLELLDEATRIRLMSEVPLGAFLSGGVDSAAVVASMVRFSAEPVRTFSIGFSDDEYDESEHARLVARELGTEHHELVVEPSALQILPRLACHYGEPFADPSAIPSFYLAEMASKHVTVALNGDGGDESFAGYRRYPYNLWLRRRRLAPGWLAPSVRAVAVALGKPGDERTLRTRLRRVGLLASMTPETLYTRLMSAFDGDGRAELLTPEFRAAAAAEPSPEAILAADWSAALCENEVDRMLSVDIETYLPGDLLVKMDIATMAHSLEARSPFLDHKLMEFAAALPPECKLSGETGKVLLKRALSRRLPASILERPKMGFGVPLARWFREDLRELPGEILLDRSAVERGYFNAGAVERLIADHVDGVADHSLKLWVLVQLEMWHREVLHAPPAATQPLA